MGKKKRLEKMVLRLAEREGKAHRLLAEYIGHWEEGDLDFFDWWVRVKKFLKEDIVNDSPTNS